MFAFWRELILVLYLIYLTKGTLKAVALTSLVENVLTISGSNVHLCTVYTIAV